MIMKKKLKNICKLKIEKNLLKKCFVHKLSKIQGRVGKHWNKDCAKEMKIEIRMVRKVYKNENSWLLHIKIS